MILVVLLAGAAGAVVRYLTTLAFARYSWFPSAVLIVNVIGSFVGGAIAASLTGDARLVLLTGLCGGLTTFSTFSVETVQLVLDRRGRVAVLSVAANLVLGVGAAALGYVLFAG